MATKGNNNSTTTLYHGTDAVFTQINTNFSSKYKDFGKGFYMATGEKHAEAIAKRKKNMRINSLKLLGKPYSHIKAYKYKIDVQSSVLGDFRSFSGKETSKDYFTKGQYGKYRVLAFRGASAEWAKFIISNREDDDLEPESPYDIVIGPTADGAVRNCIEEYFSKIKEGADEEKALEDLANQIKPPQGNKSFSTQVCIKNQRVAKEFSLRTTIKNSKRVVDREEVL